MWRTRVQGANLENAANGKTGIVVVNWNRPQETVRCIDSLLRLTYPNFEIVVVDNGSGQVQPIQARFPTLGIHRLKTNLGFTGGYNHGMRIALDRGCDYLWLVNDDLIADPDCLTVLVREMQSLPDAAFVGPLVLTSEQPDVILSAGGKIAGRRFGSCHLGKRIGDVQLAVLPVDYVSGCAILARCSAIRRIGLLYEPFFAYHEDIEWCYRAGLAGFKTYSVPSARVWHPDTRSRDEISPAVAYYINRNNLHFLARYFGVGEVLLSLSGTLRTLASWTVRPRWKDKRCQRGALVRSVIDFLLGRYGSY